MSKSLKDTEEKKWLNERELTGNYIISSIDADISKNKFHDATFGG